LTIYKNPVIILELQIYDSEIPKFHIWKHGPVLQTLDTSPE